MHNGDMEIYVSREWAAEWTFYGFLAWIYFDIILWLMVCAGIVAAEFWYKSDRSWNWRAPVESDSETV